MTSAAEKLNPTPLSVTGKRWVLRDEGFSQGLALSQRLGLPEIVGRVMANRGVGAEDARRYLEPSLQHLPDPAQFKDMDKAAARLATAITQGEKIAVFGDYDVDGSCAAAMLLRYFRAVGVTSLLYIPDRLTEGYGPNVIAMQRLKEQGAQLLITVDCGCIAFGPMAEAAKLGLDVIITDHHQADIKLPDCVAMVNPNRVDENGLYGQLSGTGVAFLLLVATNRLLREQGFFTPTKREPDLRTYLDLVATATVADVVPLTGVNRLLVAKGLQQLGTRQNPGLKSLLDIAGVDTRPQAWHLGFALGPRINAGGRISSCDLGTRLLSTDDPIEAQRLAEHLHKLNADRQALEKAVLEEATLQAEKHMASSPVALVLSADGWHPGVVGIVASRIKDLFHRPVFVLGSDGKVAKGSGRSVSGVDLGLCVQQLRPLLLAGGGHKMAAGITIEPAKIDEFRTALNEKVAGQIAKAPEALTPKLSIDGLLRPGAGTLDLLESLAQLEPFGMGNPEPRFAFSGVKIEMPKVVGDGHLQITVADLTKGRLRGIAFRAMHSELGKFLMSTNGRMISVCGTLKANTWQGNTTVQLHLEDAHTQLWEQ